MGNRTALFVRNQQGGMFTVQDITEHPGDIWFVDSGKTSTGGDTDGHGQNPDAPFLTIDYAIEKCTANNGDIIYVMPGHTETIEAAAAIACDVAGISIIGLGSGADKPTITLDTDTATTITISAANVTIKGIRFVNTQDALVVGIVVTGAYCTIEDCEFIDDATDNTIDWITLSAAADDFKCTDCVNKGTDTAGNDSFISIGATSNVQITGLVSNGDFAAANIEFTAAGIDVVIADCYLENANAVDVNIEGYAALTGWIARNSCRIATDGEVTWINTGGAASLFENYGVNNDGETGMIIGTVSTT